MLDIIVEWYKADIPHAKKYGMVTPYSTIAVHPELGRSTAKYPKGIMRELVKMINEKVWPFVSIYHDYDVVGQFYGEFLKYTGGDRRNLGIVLTPRHITELFSYVANLSKDTKVLDTCTGTGGFLISAMHYMLKLTQTDEEITHIKKNCLIGVEQQPGMFALAASNMILRGDGKANLHQGSCFDTAITADLKKHKCSVGMINPPYAQGDADLHELVFVKHMLDCLEKGGTGIAIVPMSCAISPHPMREELLAHHTLDAVMSMPDELFYPVGVVTCIMVFKAKIKHADSKRKTWFGYWKNDGFTKVKHRGRVNLSDNWEDIRDKWIDQYHNREDCPGESVTKYVSHLDEWCAEAYMETDYSKITASDFEKVVKDYAVYRLLGGMNSQIQDEDDND